MGGICPVPTSIADINQDLKDAKRIEELRKEKLNLDPVKIMWRQMYWRWTDVSNIDDLFQKLSDLLKQFEFLRSHVIEASEKMKDIAKVYVIKDGGDLIDAIQAFFLAFAASCSGGQALKEVLNLRISDKEPYIYLSCDGMNDDIQKFNKCFKKYLKAVFEAPKKIVQMMEQFEELAKAAEELVVNPRQLEQQFESLGSAYWKFRGVQYTIQNVEIAKDAGQKIKLMKPKLEQALKDIQNLAKNIETLFDIEWINAKAHEARSLNKNRPSEMLELFNPKEKWQTEEVVRLQEKKKNDLESKKKAKEAEKKMNEEKEKEKQQK